MGKKREDIAGVTLKIGNNKNESALFVILKTNFFKTNKKKKYFLWFIETCKFNVQCVKNLPTMYVPKKSDHDEEYQN